MLRRWRGYSVIAVVAVMLGMVPGGPVAYAQDSGVSGTSYVSPQFGYSLVWSGNWEVSDESSEDGFDFLQLTSRISSVNLSGATYDGSPDDWLDARVSYLEDYDGVVSLEQAEDRNGPVGGSEDGRAWALYTLVFEGESGEIEFAEYFDVYALPSGDGIVEIWLEAPIEDVDDAIDELDELLVGFSLEGEATNDGGELADEGDEAASGEFIDTLGLDLSPDDEFIVDYIAASVRDVEAYWARAYPLMMPGGEYEFIEKVFIYDSRVDVYPPGGDETLAMNAFFDWETNTMAYDLAFAYWELEGAGSLDSASLIPIAVTVAHELGHHIQGVAGWPICFATPCLDPSLMIGLELELQADCFAGAWAADAEGRNRLGVSDMALSVVSQLLIARPGDESASWGSHGTPALRAYWFLAGYVKGPSECLTASAATDPAFSNGGAEETPEPDATEEPTEEPTDEPSNDSGDSLQINDEFEVELETGTATMMVVATEFSDDVEGEQPEGTYLIVYYDITLDADEASVFPYRNWRLVDSEGNEYRFDRQATDALLLSGLENGMDELLEPGQDYTLGIVFDVPANAEGFSFISRDGTITVQLDV